MGEDRRLVYSTEHGSLGKPAQQKSAGSKKNRRQAAASSVIRNPSKQGVRIYRESKGRGGKTVSIIDGLALDDLSLKQLLKKLKSQLGTGGAVKNSMLEIQGDHREKLLVLLEKNGYKARLAGG
ncbi:MAG: translation initiation factor [Mariprofundus sp.]|nr:translation initiation factor [Mariprofundus sp.]